MRFTKLSSLFAIVNPNLFVVSIVMSVFAGLCYAMLVPFITYIVGLETNVSDGLDVQNYSFFDSPVATLAKFYLCACIAIILLRTAANVLTEYIGSLAVMKLRMSIYRKVLDLSLLDLQKVGQSRLITLLNQDIFTVTKGAMALPLVWVSAISVLGVMGYLVYLDVRVFSFVLATLLIGGATYHLPIIFATRYFMRARTHLDVIQEGTRGIIFGASELKLDKRKAEEFFNEELAIPEKNAMRDSVKGLSIFVLGGNYGEMLVFLVIGIIIFHLPYVYELSQLQLIGIVMAILYLSGPVSIILNSLETISAGGVALRKVNQVYDELSLEVIEGDEDITTQWREVRVTNLKFNYPGNQLGFGIDVRQLTFKRGEVSYIVGGNGSGKSTLSHCLTLHYLPQEGCISFDDQVITARNLISARHQVSAIYSNFFLFRGLYAKARDANPELIQQYLEYLHLSQKVHVKDGRFSTTSLSDGQRKRLALLCLLLEDRDICVFDEWAADQDPIFKDLFYNKILKDLKSKNKVVIVITHDDRYFDRADQLITMESGQVRAIERPNKSEVA
ncbi:cyclic peptide export ABC transporter [Pseudoalteromonas piscicida]|uniref:cyclic peptide export ABC transporter n=1 Tax=Pseudoalteromonas piscicida TaxID=43662 RepID=UPI0030A785D4